MSHARIEEVSDSDLDSDLDSDPSEADIEDLDEDFDESEILKQRKPAAGPRPSEVKSSLIKPSNIPSSNTPFPSHTSPDGTQFQRAEDQSKYKKFQCIYPVYFDKNRSRNEGRRVGIEDAVENPLAREIISACQMLRLETLFEPQKIHPKDWANPGRVKVKVKGANSMVKNSTCRS
jgi:signal recognition particle subunit SRP19